MKPRHNCDLAEIVLALKVWAATETKVWDATETKGNQ
jgi:hypothetical protein